MPNIISKARTGRRVVLEHLPHFATKLSMFSRGAAQAGLGFAGGYLGASGSSQGEGHSALLNVYLRTRPKGSVLCCPTLAGPGSATNVDCGPSCVGGSELDDAGRKRAGDSLGGRPTIGLLRLQGTVRRCSKFKQILLWDSGQLALLWKLCQSPAPWLPRDILLCDMANPALSLQQLVLFMSSGFDKVTAHP